MAQRPNLKKDPFKKEKSSFRLTRDLRKAKQRYFANVFAFVALAGLFVGGYFYLDYRNQLKPDSNKNEVRIEPDSFEDILNNGDVVRLINEYNLIENDPGEQLPIIVDGFQKRVKLADRLLEFKDDQQALSYGTIAKLRVLSQWDLLNVTSDFVDPNIRNQLTELANTNVENENPDIRNTAQICNTMMALYDYAMSPEDHDFQAAKDRVTDSAVLAAADMVSASVLFSCAMLLDSKNLSKEASAIFEILSEAFAESEIETIRQMAVNARKSYVAVEYDLNDIPENLDIDREGTLAVIRDRIARMLEKGEMQAEEVEGVVRLIELLMGRNEIEEARAHLPKLSESVAALQRDPNNMKEKYGKMVVEAAAFGKPLDFSGLRTASDEPIDASSIEKMVRLVVFWSPDNAVSVSRLRALNRQNQFFQRHSVEVIAIYLDEGSAPANLEYQQLIMEMPQFKLYRVHVNEDDGKGFMTRFPITQVPFLILLDNENIVRCIDPPVFRVKTELEKLTSETEKNK